METIDAVAIDRSQTDRQRDVPKPLVRNFRDERGRNFGGLSEIEQRPISFFDEPLQPSGGWAPPPASFRSTATKRVSPGPMLAECEGSATGAGAAAGAATLVEAATFATRPGFGPGGIAQIGLGNGCGGRRRRRCRRRAGPCHLTRQVKRRKMIQGVLESDPLASGATSLEAAWADREVGSGVEAIVLATLSFRYRAIPEPGTGRRV